MRRFLWASELCAWCAGLLCFAVLLVLCVQAYGAQLAGHRLSNGHSGVTSPHAVPSLVAGDSVTTPGSVMGRLEVSAIGLTVPILDDFDPSSLRKGVGHIRGTALPGGLGNMALAGHRDTFFRPLRKIKKGMTLAVYTNDGRYDYQVDSMTVVEPEEVSVLAIHDTPEMTLITCYPFEYVGSAPHRFIVRAHLRSIEPSQAAGL